MCMIQLFRLLLLRRNGNINRTVSVRTVLCTIIKVHSSYRQVDWIGLRSCLVWLCLPSASVSSLVFMALYVFNFCYTLYYTLPFSELSLVGLSLDLVD